MFDKLFLKKTPRILKKAEGKPIFKKSSAGEALFPHELLREIGTGLLLNKSRGAATSV
jgi:hypothetical protein